MDRKDLKNEVLKNGRITIDKDGRCSFVVIQINEQNFRDISPMFKKQLEDEDKYDSWINFITTEKQPPYSVQWLPIYGNSQKYVTRWFTTTAEAAIDQGLRDRQVGLLQRANNYINR